MKICLLALFLGSFASGFAAKLEDYYEIDSFPLPEGEFSVDAIAVLPSGKLACATSLSRIQIFDPETGSWSVFAEGLHTPLGILAENEFSLLVMQRPELTRLVDTDRDGRADRFETVSDDFGLTGNYAEFAFGPVESTDGGLFFGLGTGSHFGRPLTNEVRGRYSEEGAWGRMNSPTPYRGWILKVTANGETIPWASGFREPNGIGLDPEGRLFSIDNQGDWVGSSSLYHVRKGGFYGHVPSLAWRKELRGIQALDMSVQELDEMRTPPAVVFPHGDLSNSPTQPVWDRTGGKFGPYDGQLILGEMNYNRLMRVMLEEVQGEMQGAVSPIFDDPALNKGNNRLAFASDGSLWVGQTKHQAWVGESGLQRIRWNGKTPLDLRDIRLTETGFDLRFTKSIDPASALSVGAFRGQTYFYNYHEEYGSEKYDLRDLRISVSKISDDRTTVSLGIEELEAWRLYDIKIEGVKGQDGESVLNPWVIYTLNRLKGEASPRRQALPTERPNRREPRVPEGGLRGVGGPPEA